MQRFFNHAEPKSADEMFSAANLIVSHYEVHNTPFIPLNMPLFSPLTPVAAESLFTANKCIVM